MSDKHSQELLNQIEQAFAKAEGGVCVAGLSELLESSTKGRHTSVEVLPITVEELEALKELKELEKLLSDVDSNTKSPKEKLPVDVGVSARSSFAAYSYDKTTPVPLPPSITAEGDAVQYMEKQGYTHFEVYRKLGTYKAETKTEMVRQ